MSFSFTEAYLCAFKLHEYLSDRKKISALKSSQLLKSGKSILSKCVANTGYPPKQFDAKKSSLIELSEQMDKQLEMIMNESKILNEFN